MPQSDETSSRITAASFPVIMAAMRADQAVLAQQVDAMDPFDDGFDDLTNEIEAKLVLTNEPLPDMMHFAGRHTGEEADALWSAVADATGNFMEIMHVLTEKIRLANALRGRGGEEEEG